MNITYNFNGKCGVYIIMNKVNGKRYIGSSKNIYNRLHEHLHNLLNNKAHNKHLQAAWNKYGKECFMCDVIEYCEESIRFDREQYYITEYKPEYNFSLQVLANKDRKLTDEEKSKISETLKRRYKNGEIVAYNQNKLWKPHYIYDVRTLKIVYTAENKKKALEKIGVTKTHRNNWMLIDKKYTISSELLEGDALKDKIYKEIYGVGGVYKIVEHNNKYYYFLTIADCRDFLGCTVKQYSWNVQNKKATKENPWVYGIYKVFQSSEYLGLQPS